MSSRRERIDYVLAWADRYYANRVYNDHYLANGELMNNDKREMIKIMITWLDQAPEDIDFNTLFGITALTVLQMPSNRLSQMQRADSATVDHIRASDVRKIMGSSE